MKPTTDANDQEDYATNPLDAMIKLIPEERADYVSHNSRAYRQFGTTAYSREVLGNAGGLLEFERLPFRRNDFSIVAIKLLEHYGYISEYTDSKIVFLSNYEDLLEKIVEYELAMDVEKGMEYFEGLKTIIEEFNQNDSHSLQNRLKHQDNVRSTHEIKIDQAKLTNDLTADIWEILGEQFSIDFGKLIDALNSGENEKVRFFLDSIIKALQDLDRKPEEINRFIEKLPRFIDPNSSLIINDGNIYTITQLIRLIYKEPNLLPARNVVSYSPELINSIAQALLSDIGPTLEEKINARINLYVSLVTIYLERILGLELNDVQKRGLINQLRQTLTPKLFNTKLNA